MVRILVFMSDNRNLDSRLIKSNYNSLAASINYEYCKKNKYDFLYYKPYLIDKNKIILENCIDPITNQPRHASWSKLLSTTKSLQLDYDYVCYIDSDCIFKDFNKSLEDFIKPYSDKDVLFLNNKPWGDDKPCAGFYICKTNENTKKFLDEWYNFNFNGKNNPCRWEQGALWYIYKNPTYKIHIIDSWMFREHDNQFLRHISSAEADKRIPYFSSFIQSKNIDYEKNINKIQVIEFDTNFIKKEKSIIIRPKLQFNLRMGKFKMN